MARGHVLRGRGRAAGCQRVSCPECSARHLRLGPSSVAGGLRGQRWWRAGQCRRHEGVFARHVVARVVRAAGVVLVVVNWVLCLWLLSFNGARDAPLTSALERHASSSLEKAHPPPT